MGGEDPTVGGDHVAGAEQKDVADHGLTGVDLDRLAIAANARSRCGGCPQRLEGPLGAVAGRDVGADDGNQAGQHQEPVAQLAEEDREHAGHEQHEDERLRRSLPDAPSAAMVAPAGRSR